MSFLPPEIRDVSAWYGPELARRTDWIECLSAAEIAEVESPAKELEKSSVDLTTIAPDDAPLPTLGPRLGRLLQAVLGGRGFVLIRGLPVERWTRREAAIAFLVIGVHFGRLLMQNADGHLLGHVFDELASDPSLNLVMEFQPGDMQFVHNHTILHDRTAFEDFPEPERKRHLLRLWLAPPNARPLPKVYAERFGSVTPGDRGGIVVEGSKPKILFEC